MSTLYIGMQQKLKIQENYLKKVCDEIEGLPIGSLFCDDRGAQKYYYYSKSVNGARQKKYLSTKNIKQAQLISDLKRKRFLIACKKVLDGNVAALRACLLKYKEFDPSQISSRLAATYENISDATMLQLSKPRQHTLHTLHTLQSKHDQLAQQSQKKELDWQHTPYPRAEMHEENLKHEAIGGLMVRSKSEALIAFALELEHIPFHYEEIFEFDNKKIAPDFTILHPTTGERIYWEHFGMMDDPTYATETFKKLVIYGQNGIMPGKNLIYTVETNAEPLCIREIQGMITHFLMD